MCTLKDSRVTFSDASKSLPSMPKRELILRNLSQENHIKRMAFARRKGELPNAVFISPSNSSKLISKIGASNDMHTDPKPQKITKCKTKTIQLSSNDKLKNTKGNIANVPKSVQTNSNTVSSGMFSHFVLPKLSDSHNVSKQQDEKSHNSPGDKIWDKHSSPGLTNSKQAFKTSDMKNSSKKMTLPSNKLSNKKKKTKKEKAVDANVNKLETVSKIPVPSSSRKMAPLKNSCTKLTKEFKKTLKITKSEDNNQQSIFSECNSKRSFKKENMIDPNSFDCPLTSAVKEDMLSCQNNCTNIICPNIASNKSLHGKKLPEGKQIKKNATYKLTKSEKNAIIDLRLKMNLPSESKIGKQPPIMIRSSSLNVLDDYKHTRPLNKAKRSSSKTSNCTKSSRIPVASSRIEKARNKQNTFEGVSGIFSEFVKEKHNASIPSFDFNTQMKHETLSDKSSTVAFSKENAEDVSETSSTDGSQYIDKNKISKNMENETEFSENTSYAVGGNITVEGETGERFDDSKIVYSLPYSDGYEGTSLDMKLQGVNSVEHDPKEYNIGSHQFPGCTVSQECLESTSTINLMGSDTNRENFPNIAMSKFEPHFSLSKTDFLTKPIEKFMNEIKSAINFSDTDEPSNGAEPNTNQSKGLKGKKGRKGRKTGNKKKISRWSSKN